jgi:hypothetical protein
MRHDEVGLMLDPSLEDKDAKERPGAWPASVKESLHNALIS